MTTSIWQTEVRRRIQGAGFTDVRWEKCVGKNQWMLHATWRGIPRQVHVRCVEPALFRQSAFRIGLIVSRVVLAELRSTIGEEPGQLGRTYYVVMKRGEVEQDLDAKEDEPWPTQGFSHLWLGDTVYRLTKDFAVMLDGVPHESSDGKGWKPCAKGRR